MHDGDEEFVRSKEIAGLEQLATHVGTGLLEITTVNSFISRWEGKKWDRNIRFG
jgi:hypothetical protein